MLERLAIPPFAKGGEAHLCVASESDFRKPVKEIVMKYRTLAAFFGTGLFNASAIRIWSSGRTRVELSDLKG